MQIKRNLFFAGIIILSLCFCACTKEEISKVTDKIKENPEVAEELIETAMDLVDGKEVLEFEPTLPEVIATNTPIPTATSTPIPTATNTPIPTATNTPVPTATNTPIPTATNTPIPTATNTPIPTATSTPIPTATNTPIPTATSTPIPTATNTPIPTATNTPIPTVASTPMPTNTPRIEFEGDRYNKPESATYYSIEGNVDILPAIPANTEGKTLGEMFNMSKQDISALKLVLMLSGIKGINGISGIFEQVPVLLENSTYVTWYEFVMTFQSSFSGMINNPNELNNFLKKLGATSIDFSNIDINALITRKQAATLLWVFNAPNVKSIQDAIKYNERDYIARFYGTYTIGSDIAPAVFLLTNDYFGPYGDVPMRIDPGMDSLLAWVDLAYWYEVFYK